MEIARDIAERFNGVYGDVFTIPEPMIVRSGAKIMSLADPTKKMSKSDPNQNAYVLLTDKPEDILRKFKRAVTDSGSEIRRGEDKPGVNNLINIYCAATGSTPEQVEQQFAGKGYGDFKMAVGEAVVEVLRPVREKTEDLLKNKDYLSRYIPRALSRLHAWQIVPWKKCIKKWVFWQSQKDEALRQKQGRLAIEIVDMTKVESSLPCQ